MSIFPEFLKSGYLLLLSMKIYLVGCTLYIKMAAVLFRAKEFKACSITYNISSLTL